MKFFFIGALPRLQRGRAFRFIPDPEGSGDAASIPNAISPYFKKLMVKG